MFKLENLPKMIDKDGQNAFLTIRYEAPGMWFSGYVAKRRDGSEDCWGFSSNIIEDSLDKLYNRYGTGKIQGN